MSTCPVTVVMLLSSCISRLYSRGLTVDGSLYSVQLQCADPGSLPAATGENVNTPGTIGVLATGESLEVLAGAAGGLSGTVKGSMLGAWGTGGGGSMMGVGGSTGTWVAGVVSVSGGKVSGVSVSGGKVLRWELDGRDDSGVGGGIMSGSVLDCPRSAEKRMTRTRSTAEQEAASDLTMRRCCVDRRYQQLGRLPACTRPGQQ